MAVNGHNKGSSFERKICVELSKWWTYGERDDIFWRSAGSGARATVRHRKGTSTSTGEGDVTYADADGKPLTDVFCIELKCGYGDWSLTDFLERDQKITQFEEFWKQASESAANAHSNPMLIFKRDRKNAIVVISKSMYLSLCNYTSFRIPRLTFVIDYGALCSDTFWVCKLADFLDCVTPEIIKELSKGGSYAVTHP